MCYFLNFIFAYIYCKKELPKKNNIFFTKTNLFKTTFFYSKFLIIKILKYYDLILLIFQ